MKKYKIAILTTIIIIAFGFSMMPTNAMTRAPPGADIVQILSPSEGETVSGTITIQLSKTVDIYIDEVLVASSVSSYNWDTTTVGDGTHIIKALGSRGYDVDQVTVTVNNGGGTVDNPPTVTITNPAAGAIVTGMVSITVDVTDDIDSGLVADIYIDGVFITHANSYSWDTTAYADGAYTIYAEATDSGSNIGDDSISVTVNNGGSSGGDGINTKWVVIVGISDYKAISDLSYCDEDATDWFNFLKNDFDHIWVFGDGHTNDYPQYDGYATEYNVKQAINTMVAGADEDDTIAYLSSGHGSGDRRGMGYLCMWDCGAGESGEDGNLYDYEFDDLIAPAVAGEIFIFLDHCYSGAFGPELMALSNSENIYVATTCTDRGYGYDDPEHNNGMWTYYFLDFSWQQYYGGSHSVSLEDVFTYAHANYPVGRWDEPQEFDGSTAPFYLF